MASSTSVATPTARISAVRTPIRSRRALAGNRPLTAVTVRTVNAGRGTLHGERGISREPSAREARTVPATRGNGLGAADGIAVRAASGARTTPSSGIASSSQQSRPPCTTGRPSSAGILRADYTPTTQRRTAELGIPTAPPSRATTESPRRLRGGSPTRASPLGASAISRGLGDGGTTSDGGIAATTRTAPRTTT